MVIREIQAKQHCDCFMLEAFLFRFYINQCQRHTGVCDE